jgi:hypothetical protein
MSYPTYTKAMRERAKAERLHLVTVDFVRPGGSREINYQGPMLKKDAKVILDAWIMVMTRIGRRARRVKKS